MDQIVLKRGNDERAVAIDSADSKGSFAQARAVIDEWERTPFADTVESERLAAESRVTAAQTALDQANKARDDLAANYNTGDNSPKGTTTTRTGNQKKASTKSSKSSSKKSGKGR